MARSKKETSPHQLNDSSSLEKGIYSGVIQGAILPHFKEDTPPCATAYWVDRKFGYWISKLILQKKIESTEGLLHYIPIVKANRHYHFFIIGMGSRENWSEKKALDLLLIQPEKIGRLSVGRIGLPIKDFLPNQENITLLKQKISEKLKHSSIQLY